MNIGTPISHYVCNACKRSITHELAVSLVTEKIRPNISTERLNKVDMQDSDKKQDSGVEEGVRATLQQQLYGPVTTWMCSQRSGPVIRNYGRVAHMLNKGLPCPFCKSKGSWLWNSCRANH